LSVPSRVLFFPFTLYLTFSVTVFSFFRLHLFSCDFRVMPLFPALVTQLLLLSPIELDFWFVRSVPIVRVSHGVSPLQRALFPSIRHFFLSFPHFLPVSNRVDLFFFPFPTVIFFPFLAFFSVLSPLIIAARIFPFLCRWSWQRSVVIFTFSSPYLGFFLLSLRIWVPVL